MDLWTDGETVRNERARRSKNIGGILKMVCGGMESGAMAKWRDRRIGTWMDD